MFTKILVITIEGLFKCLSIEDVKDFVDGGLDRLEDKYPDNLALRASIAGIRKLTGIKDELYGIDKVEQEGVKQE